MNRNLRVAGGVLVLTSSGYALGQPAPAPSSASQPPAEPIKTPADPTWMVADVAIALVVGVIVGYMVGARRGRAAASHA